MLYLCKKNFIINRIVLKLKYLQKYVNRTYESFFDGQGNSSDHFYY